MIAEQDDILSIYNQSSLYCNDSIVVNCTLCPTGVLCDQLSTTSTVYPPPLYPPVATGFLALIAALTSICTTVGNILVVLAFILERHIRQPSNYLIASLAVTDILIGVVSMPLYTLYLLKAYWPLGRLLCDLWLSLDYTVCLVSQYTVFLITLDRFCSVKAPAKYRNWRTTRKIKIMIAVTWLVPALIFFTSILGWHRFTGSHPNHGLDCYAQFQTDPLFTAILVISYYWVTLVIMTGLYIGIYRVALSLHLKAREKRNRIKAMRHLIGNNYDLEPLNSRNAANSELKLSNGAAKTGRNIDKSSSESSRHQEDSEISNEISSDSTYLKRFDHSPIPGSNSHNPLHSSLVTQSPLWKPRTSLPTSSINWDAFSEENYSTLQKDGVIEEEKLSIRAENELNGNNAKVEDDDTDSETLISHIARIFSQITKIRFCQKGDNSDSSPRTKSKSENRAHKALRTITFILGAFVLCWTPYHVVVLVDAFCRDCVNPKFYQFTYWLCYMNSPLNPFCYALSNQQFKQAFIKIIKGEYSKSKCGCCKR